MSKRRPAILFMLCAASGIAYFLISGLGLLAGIGGSHLNRSPEFSLSIRPRYLVIGLALTLALALLYRLRRPVTAAFLRLLRSGRDRPLRTLLLCSGALLLLHAMLFLPFRYNELRLPAENDAAFEIEYRDNQPELVPARGGFEDYTRNYVVSRSIWQLGASRYFNLHRAPELTAPEQNLCEWGLRNHPPGYHLLLAPFTVDPLLARGLSLVLYGIVMLLAYLVFRPLVGPVAAAIGTLVFWGTPGNMFFIGMMTSNDLAVAVPILAALALITNARHPATGRLIIAGLLLGIAFVTKYTAVLGLGLAGLILLVRWGVKRGLIASLVVLASAIPVYVGWFALLAGTEVGGIQHEKYVVTMFGKITDPSRIGSAKSAARGTLLDFFAFLPAEWGPPAFLIALAASCWLLLRFFRVGRDGILTFLIFALPMLAAVIAIPKTNYIYFAQAALFCFAGLFLLRVRGSMEAVLCAGAAVLYGMARVVLFGLQTL